VTGSPGTGKSTLCDALVAALRAAGHRVGVVAVDPSSPFSGGAILGDRVRMQRHAADPGVFIRSLATRGRLGGLSASAGATVQVLDAMGFDRILVETVGVGQDEVAVAGLADLVVVVVAPGLGDDVQAQKAGVLEIADLLVVNKADLAGAERAERDLRASVDLAPPGARRPPVLRTIAHEDTGVAELLSAIEAGLAAMATEGRLAAAGRARTEALVADLALDRAAEAIRTLMSGDPALWATIEAVHRREATPAEAARAVLAAVARALP
jgi:LAO/AO transport system kinase